MATLESLPTPLQPAPDEPPFALSVDVEDYFQVQAFAGLVPRSRWEDYPRRVEANVDHLLALFAETGAIGTFFVLGWVAERHPAMVRRIASCGHEIGSHGMSHRMLTDLSADQVREEVTDSRRLLEDVSGQRVEGFRAPTYSVNRNTLWALGLLVEAGYSYDSSVFPIRRRRYGYPGGPTAPVRMEAGAQGIAEFPMTTIKIGPARLPVLAGSYLRLLPAWVSMAAVNYHRPRRLPLVVNVHPWEIDPGQPTIPRSRLRAWTHYGRLSRTAGTLRKVLRMARFADLGSRLREMGLVGVNGARP